MPAMRAPLHIVLHFLVPALAVLFLPRGRRFRVWLVLVSTMAVDLDHLLSRPIYDADRCSLGFHPLHTWPAITVYAIALVLPKIPPKVRWVAFGLCLHMGLDLLDCWSM